MDSHQSLYRALGDRGPISTESTSASCRPDVLIIGGGVTGLAAAHELVRPGQQVTIVDRAGIGETAAGLSGGMLTLNVETDYADLGLEAAAVLLGLSRSGTISMLSLITQEKLECSLVSNQESLYLSPRPGGRAMLEEELQIREGLGIEGCRVLEGTELRKLFDSPVHPVALHEETAHSLDPRAFTRELARLLVRRGAAIFENEAVETIDMASKTAITRQGKTIAFGQLILASGLSPLTRDLFPEARQRVLPVATHLLATAPLPSSLVSALFPSDSRPLLWDTRLFYNYCRLTAENRMLFGGATAILSMRQADEQELHRRRSACLSTISREFGRFFPTLAPCRPEFFWGGIIAAPIDDLPFIGSLGRSSHAALFAPGLNLAFASGQLVAKLVRGEEVDPMTRDLLDLHRPVSWRSRLTRLAAEIPLSRWLMNQWGQRHHGS